MRRFLSRRGAIEETLDVGQEGDEFLVVPLLELRRITTEDVIDFAPGIADTLLAQRFPMALHLLTRAERHQLQWPEYDLAVVPDCQLARHRLTFNAPGLEGGAMLPGRRRGVNLLDSPPHASSPISYARPRHGEQHRARPFLPHHRFRAVPGPEKRADRHLA